MLKEYEIRGLRVEKYIQRINKIDYIESERYVFNCIQNKKNYEIIMYLKYINHEVKKTVFKIKEIRHFVGTSYLPIQIFSIMLDTNKKEHYNEAFDFNETNISIKYDNFKKSNRLKKIRPVWIVKGQSGLGKSYLTSILSNNSNLTIYETDSNSKLADIICEDIIVIGNKHDFSIEEIEGKIYGRHESIIINFDKKI